MCGLSLWQTIQLAMTESIHKTVGVVSGMLSRMDATADMREFIGSLVRFPSYVELC